MFRNMCGLTVLNAFTKISWFGDIFHSISMRLGSDKKNLSEMNTFLQNTCILN